MTEAASGIPAGFATIDVGGEFMAHNGPLWARWHDAALVVGLRIESRHCNPMGQCHGGMLATFADMLLPYGAMYQLDVDRRFTPTISLQIDFLAPVVRGAWLEGRAEALRSTRSLLFAQGVLRVEGEAVVRASGVFKWGEFATAGRSRDPFGLRPSDGS